MRNSISKAIAAGLTGLILSAAVISSTSPASAVIVHGGGFGGGMHGGGFAGGSHPGFGSGFHPGFQPGFAGFRPGFRPGFVGFHHRFFHRPFFASGVWVAGWGGDYGYGNGNGCWDYRPAYDAWGNFLGQSYVYLCQ